MIPSYSTQKYLEIILTPSCMLYSAALLHLPAMNICIMSPVLLEEDKSMLDMLYGQWFKAPACRHIHV